MYLTVERRRSLIETADMIWAKMYTDVSSRRMSAEFADFYTCYYAFTIHAVLAGES